jgi:hypothetical protein
MSASNLFYISIFVRVVVLFKMTSLPFYLLSSKGHGLGFEQGHCKLRHLNRAAQFEE